MNFIIIGIFLITAISLLIRFLRLQRPYSKKFCEQASSLLVILHDYFQAVSETFLKIESSLNIEIKKNLIESYFQLKKDHYPHWVDKPGFNSMLKPGFQSFMRNIDRIYELIICMHIITKLNLDDSLRTEFKDLIQIANDQTSHLFSTIAACLLKGELDFDEHTDMLFSIEDVSALEKKLNQNELLNLEYLNSQKDYFSMAKYIRALRDLREVLLALICMLPPKIQER